MKSDCLRPILTIIFIVFGFMGGVRHPASWRAPVTRRMPPAPEIDALEGNKSGRPEPSPSAAHRKSMGSRTSFRSTFSPA